MKLGTTSEWSCPSAVVTGGTWTCICSINLQYDVLPWKQILCSQKCIYCNIICKMLFHISVCSISDSIVSYLPQQLETLFLLCQMGLRLHTCTILLPGSQGWKFPAGCQKFCAGVVHFRSTMLCLSFVHCKWDSILSQLHGIWWSLVARWWLAGLQMQV